MDERTHRCLARRRCGPSVPALLQERYDIQRTLANRMLVRSEGTWSDVEQLIERKEALEIALSKSAADEREVH